jgi:hypothetical protein
MTQGSPAARRVFLERLATGELMINPDEKEEEEEEMDGDDADMLLTEEEEVALMEAELTREQQEEEIANSRLAGTASVEIATQSASLNDGQEALAAARLEAQDQEDNPLACLAVPRPCVNIDGSVNVGETVNTTALQVGTDKHASVVGAQMQAVEHGAQLAQLREAASPPKEPTSSRRRKKAAPRRVSSASAAPKEISSAPTNPDEPPALVETVDISRIRRFTKYPVHIAMMMYALRASEVDGSMPVMPQTQASSETLLLYGEHQKENLRDYRSVLIDLISPQFVNQYRLPADDVMEEFARNIVVREQSIPMPLAPVIPPLSDPSLGKPLVQIGISRLFFEDEHHTNTFASGLFATATIGAHSTFAQYGGNLLSVKNPAVYDTLSYLRKVSFQDKRALVLSNFTWGTLLVGHRATPEERKRPGWERQFDGKAAGSFANIVPTNLDVANRLVPVRLATSKEQKRRALDTVLPNAKFVMHPDLPGYVFLRALDTPIAPGDEILVEWTHKEWEGTTTRFIQQAEELAESVMPNLPAVGPREVEEV